MVDLPPRETNPIGVIKRGCSPQRFSQPGGITEVQAPDLNRRFPRGAAGMAGQRAHPAAGGLQFPGDRRSGVAERPGDNVEPSRPGLARHRITPVSYAGHRDTTSVTVDDHRNPRRSRRSSRLAGRTWRDAGADQNAESAPAVNEGHDGQDPVAPITAATGSSPSPWHLADQVYD